MSEVQVDLSSFSEPVQIAFRYTSDESIESVGWEIDDVTISSAVPCIVENHSGSGWRLYK